MSNPSMDNPAVRTAAESVRFDVDPSVETLKRTIEARIAAARRVHGEPTVKLVHGVLAGLIKDHTRIVGLPTGPAGELQGYIASPENFRRNFALAAHDALETVHRNFPRKEAAA